MYAKQYQLMNKDRPVAIVSAHEDGTYRISHIIDRLPYGIGNSGIINGWIDNRKASKHNRHLASLMQQCGCGTTDGYLQFTHSATLNDTFWIKSADEEVKWADISLYRNEFNEVVSRLAFEGGELYGFEFSSTIPELTTDGSFRKCWRREANGIYLYKRGRDDAGNAGLEPFSEVLASELAGKLCYSYVKYDLATIHQTIASKCRLFTSEEMGYIPYSILVDARRQSLKEIEQELCKRGVYAESFRRMIVLDAVILNTDRHLGNFGVTVDNDTLEVQELAPVFDLNLALMPYLSIDEIKHFGKRSIEFTPSIGNDFIDSAKQMMTSDIRANLINLSGFHFAMRDYKMFPRERIEALERIVNTNIGAILGRDKMYLVDVYPHIPSKQEIEEKKLDRAYAIGDILAYDKGLAYDFNASVAANGDIELSVYADADVSECCVFYDGLKRHRFMKDGKRLEFDGPRCDALNLESKYKAIIHAVNIIIAKDQNIIRNGDIHTLTDKQESSKNSEPDCPCE